MGDDPCARLMKVAELYGVDYETTYPCDLPRALASLYMSVRSSRPYVPVDDILADMAKHLETSPLYLMPVLLREEDVRGDLVPEMLVSLYRRCRRAGRDHVKCVDEARALLLGTLRDVVGPTLLREVADIAAATELQDVEPPIDSVEYDVGEARMRLGVPREGQGRLPASTWAPLAAALAFNPALLVLGLPLGYLSLPLLGLFIALYRAGRVAVGEVGVWAALAAVLAGLAPPVLLAGRYLLLFSWLSIAGSMAVRPVMGRWAGAASVALAALGTGLALLAPFTPS